jgi:hypothetical protein
MTPIMVLKEILVKLPMGAKVFNLKVRLKKCLDSIWISCWLHTVTNIVVEELQVKILPRDQVGENNTCHHDVVVSCPKNEPDHEQ